MDELTVSISWRAAPAWSSCLTPSVKGTNVETTKTVLNSKNKKLIEIDRFYCIKLSEAKLTAQGVASLQKISPTHIVKTGL